MGTRTPQSPDSNSTPDKERIYPNLTVLAFLILGAGALLVISYKTLEPALDTSVEGRFEPGAWVDLVESTSDSASAASGALDGRAMIV